MPNIPKHTPSFNAFFKLYHKVLKNPSWYTGFYTDNIALSKDLIHWLKANNLFKACTQDSMVLKKDSIRVIMELKPFISLDDLKPHLNAIDEYINLKKEA